MSGDVWLLDTSVGRRFEPGKTGGVVFDSEEVLVLVLVKEWFSEGFGEDWTTKR